MSQFVDASYKSFTAGAATGQFIRVKLVAGLLVMCTAFDRGIGVMRDASFAAGDVRAVRLRNANGTSKCVASGAIAMGADVYGDANGLVTATPVAGAFYAGTSLDVASASGDVIEVLAPGHGGAALDRGSLTFTPAAGAANVSNVTAQVVDGAGNPLAGVVNLDLWLSDSPVGAGMSVTTASGTVTAGTAGIVLGTYTAKQALRVQTDATGKFILAITDTGKTHFYVAGQTASGFTAVSAQLLTANYG